MNYEICVRAVIRHQNKILVCRYKKRTHYFFPGGHVEFGEKAEKALGREMKEELGLAIKKYKFIGVVENIYSENKRKHHEINLVFDAEIGKIKTASREDHIYFTLMDVKEFSQARILPIALKRAIIIWLKNKKEFWESQIQNRSSLN